MLASQVLVLAIIVISTVGIFNKKWQDKLAFIPYAIKHQKQWYRFFTCSLVHANFFHLVVNMFVLKEFGRHVELIYASIFSADYEHVLFFILFFTGSAASVLISYRKFKNDEEYSAIGASGAISAVVFTVLIYKAFSNSDFGYFQISIAALAFIYLLYNAILNYNKYKKVNHDAHLYGAVYGIVINIVVNPSLILTFWYGVKRLL